MSLVSFIWIYNLGTRFGDPQVKEQANKDIKPFKLFSNSISDTYKNVSSSIGEISREVNTKKEGEKQIDLIPTEYTNQ